MKHQDSNPAYIRFSDMLPASGRYPAKHVDIFWNKDLEAYRITEVEVVFIPRSKLSSDREFQVEYSAYNKRWGSDLGNSTRGWMTDEGYTPEIIFGHLLSIGFATPDVLEKALEEFANIVECDWARLMLTGLRDQ